MIDEATLEQANALEKLRAELEEGCVQSEKAIDAAADALYQGQVKLGELEAGKVMLRAKQECVGLVYDGVRERILDAPDAEYLALVKKLISEYAEDGDEVIISSRDTKRITADWLEKAAGKKKLALSKSIGEFSGGIVLRNKRFDRDLSVDAIVDELKERTAVETLAKLGL